MNNGGTTHLIQNLFQTLILILILFDFCNNKKFYQQMKNLFFVQIILIYSVSINSMKIHSDPLPDAFDYLSNIDPTIIQSVRYHST